MNKEEWRFISGYEGLYTVSNKGRVKSFWYGKERILKQTKNPYGYLFVNLYKNGKRKTFTVHTLVYDAFGSGKRNGFILQVDHLNSIKIDNRIENLQLLSARDNSSKGKLQKEKTSKYTGVTWDKKNKKWITHININGKNKYLGHFTSEEKASEAYQYALNHQDEILNRPSKKSSKYKGVTYYKPTKKWLVQICVIGKKKHIGYFSTQEEAAEAYLKAKESL